MSRRRIVAAMIAAQWRPTKLGSCEIWIDPSDLSTLFQDSAGLTPVTASGDPVGRANDKSGNGNDFIQTISANRPIYRTDGVLHWLEFNGVNQCLESALDVDLSDTDKVSIFFGQYKANDTSSRPIFSNNNNNPPLIQSFGLFAPQGGGANSYRIAARGSLTTPVVVGTGVFAPAPDTAVITCLIDIAAPLTQLRRNGSSVESSSSTLGTGNFISSKIRIGSYLDGVSFMNGNAYQIVLCKTNLSNDDISKAENFVARKTGISL